MGRSYGDSCLNSGGTLIDCRGLDRILHFDNNTGRIVCEAGVSLATILEVVVPRGWFLPVTPGTKFVTVGGAIANDVHGKNHHCAGTFGCHVLRFEIARSDGSSLICSPTENSELYAATIAGLGLTGVILWAELQLKSIAGSAILVETIPFHSLDDFIRLSVDSADRFEYTVAWIDCLARNGTRGLFYRGNHADNGTSRAGATGQPGLRVPFPLPECTLNRITTSLFNQVYYWKGKLHSGNSSVHYDPFFYPLDAVGDWHFLYGKRGLTQYQCVVPDSEAQAFESILRVISSAGQGSFLGVIKQFGTIRSPGLMSFPRPGLTLALDFPFRGERTLRLFGKLDKIVADAGGALYPAKDARMNSMMFAASYPNLETFQRYVDPAFSSSFWRRVMEQDR